MLKAALRDSLIYGLASILSKGLMIFLLPLYTRVLSPGDFGAFDLLITLGALANLSIALEVSQGLARYWGDTEGGGQRRVLASTTFWFTLAMYGAFLVVTLWLSPRLNQLILGDASYLLAFRLGLGFIAINGVYYLLLNQFRWELRSKAYAIVSFCYALLTLVFALVLCLLCGWGLEGVMLGQLLAALCCSLMCLWLLRGTFGFTFDRLRLAAMLRFSIPLVPAGLAVFVSLYINRVALAHFSSLEEVGLFGIGSRIAGLSVLLILGIQAALTPLVYQHHKDPQTPAQIARLFSWFTALALAACLFLTVFSRELLTVFAPAEYLAGASLVVFLAPALLLSQMYIFAPGIAIQKKTMRQLWVTVFSAVVSALSNWLLVPHWGVKGAALATLFTAVVFFLTWLAVSQRLYRIPYDWRACLLGIAGFVGCALASVELDRLDLYLPLSLALKSLLMAVLLIVVVASGLLPMNDVRAMLTQLRRRMGWAA